MKLHKTLSILGAVFALSSCEQRILMVDANLDNLEDGNVYLAAIDQNMQWSYIDTTRAERGHFVFETEASKEGEAYLVLTPAQQQILMFAGCDDVYISGDIDKPASIVIRGSALNDKYNKFVNGVPETERLKKLDRELRTANYDVDRTNAIKEDIYNAQMEQLVYIKHFINKNVDNPLGSFVLINSINYFTFEEADALSKNITSKQPNHKYTHIFSSIVENRRSIYEAMRKVDIGQIAPEFILEDASGNQHKLSDYRGQNVLINFWASNDVSSNINNESLKEIDYKFASKGLTIISISVDQDKERWRNFIKGNKLPGVQLVDTLNAVAATYCVPRLPYCLLLDGEGQIVTKEQGIESIFSDVESFLSK
ncbi:MAG: AhpC/TSA family protein [Bacteroidales bacterium]|nr:AhpC/TSA family protein [Bacteroidales bacterium]